MSDIGGVHLHEENLEALTCEKQVPNIVTLVMTM